MIFERRPWRARWAAVALLAAGAVVMSGCSSGSGNSGSSNGTTSPASSSPSSPSAMHIPCNQIRALRTSMENLAHRPVSSTTASQIQADLKTIQGQLAALKKQVTGAFTSQLTQVSNALDQVRKAAQGLTNNPSAAQVQALSSALAGLRRVVEPMVSEVDAVCPHSSS